MIYTLEDFIREYSNIVNMGWVKTHRAGPTGIGKTLVSENFLAAFRFARAGTPLP